MTSSSHNAIVDRPGPFRPSDLSATRHRIGLLGLLALALLAGCGGNGGSSTTVTVTVTVPGAPTLSSVTGGDAQATVAFSAPASNGGASITSYTVTCTAGSASVQASGAASPITVSGLSNGTLYACGVAATNSAGTGASSSTLSVTPTAPVATAVTYGTPAVFTDVLKTAYTWPSLTLASGLVQRGRYLISDAATHSASTSYLGVGGSYSATTGFAVEGAVVPASPTVQTVLNKLVQAVEVGTGTFRLDAHLHPNQSLDADPNDSFTLKFRNNFGKASVTYGYVTFSYDAGTRLLQASRRYLYTYDSTTYAASYTEDTAFLGAGYYVKLAGGAFSLVANSAQATALYIFDSPLDFGIPTKMNPAAVPYVTNAAAPFISKTSVAATEGASGLIATSVNATYHAQVAVAGSDAGTKAAADSLLASIKTTVEAAGEKLRYAPAVYTAFRDAALATTLASDAIADGTPGQNLVPYVYFTNEQDTTGKYHPFMIVVSYGNPASQHGLLDVPHPPGDGNGAGYGDQKVTRFTNLDNYIAVFPMKDYGLVSAVTDNTLPRTLLSDAGAAGVSADVYNYASTADNGLLINGAVMFPVYNNTLVPSQLVGELSANGCHVGRGGGGPHCHADGYPNGKAPGLALYGDADYVGQSHPPLIGFGYDGVALFGVYRTQDTAMLGASTALDSFGGHDHDSIGYHYHAHSVPNYPLLNSAGTTTLNVLMKGAFKGSINSVPYFFQRSSFSTNKYLGGTVAP
jgi:hypothetical protein